MRFRGRQIAYVDNGKEVVRNFIDQLKDLCSVEQDITLKGRSLHATLVPIAAQSNQKDTRQEQSSSESSQKIVQTSEEKPPVDPTMENKTE